MTIPVIDLFAGPGGLSEGFSTVRDRAGESVFDVVLSIEKDPLAWRTLRLRSLVRQLDSSKRRRDYYAFLREELTESELFDRHPVAAARANEEAWNAELGSDETPPDEVSRRIGVALRGADPWVLIGGPPCQAYSVIGRSRNQGIDGYRLETDARHRLYEHYLQILAEHRPAVFIMENVKGLLSAKVAGQSIIERITADLAAPSRALGDRHGPRYNLVGLASSEDPNLFSDDPRRFIIRAERHGIPQRRHRVIVVGIRSDISDAGMSRLEVKEEVPAWRVLLGLPPLRSGLSAGDSREAWIRTIVDQRERRWVTGNATIENQREVAETIRHAMSRIEGCRLARGGQFVVGSIDCKFRPEWFLAQGLDGACNHHSKGHMPSDLHRYLFAAGYAHVNEVSPTLECFPPDLLPMHRNSKSGHFNDRFRVQVRNEPSTTVTSHIHKDGHYYIHFDPKQCRSLTVREAARLQTFPDDYFFSGPRTSQYLQVGNAVPPLLARQIAKSVSEVLSASCQVV